MVAVALIGMANVSSLCTLTDGRFRYGILDSWGRFPEGTFVGDVAAVAVDRNERVYLFTRGEHPLIVLDRQGNMLRTWGHGMFSMPHGLHIGPDDHIYCTDVGDHTVRKFSLDGKLVLQIGVPGHPSPRLSNRPFNLCTHTALAPNGDIYVSDGYGNASVHRFAPDGKYLNSWGACGSGPGEFYIPHNIICDDDGWVYVADRENHRIQVFDGKGRYEAQWNNLYRPCALCRRNDGLFFVGELAPAIPTTLDFPNIGARISILHKDGRIAGRLGDLAPGTGVGQFIAPHGIALDGRGDLYVGEVSYAAWRWSFPDIEMPRHLTTVRKLLDYSDCPNSEPSHELKEPYR